MNIFVGNLPFRMSAFEIEKLFSAYGAINSVRVILDRHTGRSRGFGFVDMPDYQQAREAISILNGYEIQGRPISVNSAHTRACTEPQLPALIL